MVWDKEVFRDYFYTLKLEFCDLMSAIEKYNNEIRQGWSLNKEIKFDEELLRIALEEYNNSFVGEYCRKQTNLNNRVYGTGTKSRSTFRCNAQAAGGKHQRQENRMGQRLSDIR